MCFFAGLEKKRKGERRRGRRGPSFPSSCSLSIRQCTHAVDGMAKGRILRLKNSFNEYATAAAGRGGDACVSITYIPHRCNWELRGERRREGARENQATHPTFRFNFVKTASQSLNRCPPSKVPNIILGIGALLKPPYSTRIQNSTIVKKIAKILFILSWASSSYLHINVWDIYTVLKPPPLSSDFKLVK